MKTFFQRFNGKGELVGDYPRITNEDTLADFPERKNGLNILLIHVPIREWSYPNIFPIGEGYIASVAKMDGHRVHVLDLNAERKVPVNDWSIIDELIQTRVTETLLSVQPDLIGFGGIITQYATLKKAVITCKKVLPKVPIVLGGGIGSSMPEFMLRHLDIDIVIQEEGEATFSELAYRMENNISLAGLQGTAYKHYSEVINNGRRASIAKGEAGLDGIPWPLRQLWPIDEIYADNPVGHLNWENKWTDGRGDNPKRSVSLIGSRGCPYAKHACDYCYASYLGEQYRLRSPKDVVDEMYYLSDQYRIEYVHFLDDLFLTDWRWVLRFCDELESANKRSGKLVEWGATCRTNIVADDVRRAKKQNRPSFIHRAHEVGLRHIGFGVESASPTILKAIDKSGQTIEKMEIAIREVQNVLGYADCSFMVGSPGETKRTVEETVEFCKRVDLRPEVFFFTTAYPGTKFWDLAMTKGLIKKAVTGELGPADQDMVERYLLMLGEQGSHVRTNFSETDDKEIVELTTWAVNELNPMETKFKREPHSGDVMVSVTDASRASL